MAKKFKVKHFREYCKSCQLCLKVCPKSVYKINERGQVVVDDDTRCIGCQQCYWICPDFALEVVEDVS